MTTQDEVLDYARQSTRPPGKCLGLANNDIVGHFGRLGNTPWSATAAADELAKAGQLYESACPDYPHVDFYYFKENGIEYGHVDWHFPQRGIHLADSSRITVKLNASGTVGTYPSWGPRRGWARVPALGASISIVNDAVPVYTPPPANSDLGPIISSGKDWGYRRPAGDLAKRVVRALQGKSRLPIQGYSNDGDPREVFDRAVQHTLNVSGTFRGLEDGKIERGGCYGIQDYAARYGDYKQHGGQRDGWPGTVSWSDFALGLERP